MISKLKSGVIINPSVLFPFMGSLIDLLNSNESDNNKIFVGLDDIQCFFGQNEENEACLILIKGEIEKTVVLGYLGGRFKFDSSTRLSEIDERVKIELQTFLIENYKVV